MRPALAALAEQQREIDALKKNAQNQNEALGSLGRGLQALAQLAGVEPRVAKAMLRRQADVQNPAQPVPEPPAQPAPQSTQDAKTPEAFADVNAPGMAPGTTNDVAADATTTAYTPGMDIAAPAFHELVDVTAPVEGTQTPLPLNQVKTLTDVRVGDPMNPEVAFPLRGDFANAQRTSSVQGSNRTMACLRLARLQIAAGMAEGGDILVATGLEKDASLSTRDVEAQISTLERVQKAATRRARNPRLVPRPASAGQRSVPSLQATASHAPSTSGEEDLTDLFD